MSTDAWETTSGEERGDHLCACTHVYIHAHTSGKSAAIAGKIVRSSRSLNLARVRVRVRVRVSDSA